jgi:cell division protein FtsA
MASNNLMIGLEIGTSKICVVVGESRPDGTVKILGVGQTPSRGVRKGEIVDFETAMKCVHEAVVDAEQKSDVMIRSVYVAVGGSHLQSFNNRGCVTLSEDRDEIEAALSHARNGIDFADALHLAASKACSELLTFDHRGFARRARKLRLKPPVQVAMR